MAGDGRVCMVTGASRGVGEAIARTLSGQGHRVALVARGRAELEAVAATLPAESLVVPADLTVAERVEDAFASVEAAWGPIEVLVANAGAGFAGPLAETSDDDWQRMLDVNLTAPFRCVRRVLPAMQERGWGRIVVVASVVAKRGESQVAAYTAAKHGVLGLVRAAAAEVARSGVTVNAVCPGYVDTPMTADTVTAIAARTGRSEDEAARLLARRQPIGRLIEPAEVAEAVDLCVRNAGINGQGINVDGGAVQS